MGRTTQTTKTEQTTQTKSTNSKTTNKNEIPMPAPVKEAMIGFEDESESTEFSLTTSLDMYEVKDEIKLRDALFNARDKHYLNKEKNLCIFFARGKIDNWCAYVAKRDEDRKWHLYAPKDKFYFERIFYVAYNQDKAYPNRKQSPFQRIYNEVMHIAEIMFFDPTHVSEEICNEIDRIVISYTEENEIYQDMLKLALYEIYYGMIAEENKEGTILGRKIKMLGLYDMLINRKGINVSCDCNRNVPVGVLMTECNNIGYAWLAANDDENALTLENLLTDEVE